MPEFEFTDAEGESEPLFPENDPLTFTLPDPETGNKLRFRCVDKSVLPKDDAYGLDTRPRSYLLDTLAQQVVDDDQAKVREVADALFDDGFLDEDKLMELFKFLNDERKQARKALGKKKLRRPTTAPGASTS